MKYEIFCNHCGSKMTIESFEIRLKCGNCQTFLKVEEKETTIAVTVIEEKEFLESRSELGLFDGSENKRQFLQRQLVELKESWERERETLKVKNGKNRNLPRRKQSLYGLLTGLGMAFFGIYSFLFADGNYWVLLIVGVSFVYSSGREYNKFRKLKEAEEDYFDKKERLEYEIASLKTRF